MPETEGVARSAGPIRGTESFVGVMSAVWGRPSLTVLEMLWRWSVGVPIVALVAWETLRVSRMIHLDIAALEAMTVFQPVAAFGTMHAAMAAIVPVARPIAAWLFPLAAAIWLVAAAFGRTMVLRRFDGTLHARPLTLLALGTVRDALLGVVWAVWVRLVVQAGRIAITGRAEPNIVLYCAMLICGTLILYVLWAIFNWPLQLASLLAMQGDFGPMTAFRAALGSTRARGKLIEINLVMHIVKIAVLVLAMVFSASPLPFSSVETQTFLNCWWGGVILLYLAALDYFHVVRAAAYLSLWRRVEIVRNR